MAVSWGALASSPALAATLSLSPNTSFVQGCPSNVQILVDSQGANLLAGDTSLNYLPGNITVNTLTPGSIFPLSILSQINTSDIKMSASRFPGSGTFTGSGTFGTLSITPALGTSSFSLDFNPDLVTENVLADDQTNNVLTSATGRTYTVQNRYNTEVNGVGFCSPDTQGPTFQLLTPVENSYNNAKNTDFIFTVQDDRTGVNLDTLTVTINGILYSMNSPQLLVERDGTNQRIIIDPLQDFTEGSSVPFSIIACDLNTPRANCSSKNGSFGVIYTTTQPGGICGNGILEPLNGEVCDDGNKKSGDGCSAFCITEVINPNLPSCYDGFMNQGEIGIDCGGPCTAACPTCVDGKQNQGEEGIDCGGPCPSCDETLACVNYVANVSGESQIITLKKGEIQKSPEPEKETATLALPGLASLFPNVEQESMPKNYSANILSIGCESEAPTRYIEITQPFRGLISSDLKPAISGAVDQEATKVLLWRREKNVSTGELSRIKEKIGEVMTFGDFPKVSQCDLVKHYKSFNLQNYEAFPNKKTYVIEAEAIHEEKNINQEKYSSSVEIQFDSEVFAKAPEDLYLEDKPVDSFSEKIGSWFQNAFAENEENPLIIQNSQPTLHGKTEKGVQVFAVWRSTVLQSETAATSEEGQFSVKAPRSLAKNKAHTVTVYAIKSDENGNRYQSPKVIVPFVIEPNPIIIKIILIVSALSFISFIGIGIRKNLITSNFKKITNLVGK
jgi:cysteine-rich repeat protein